MRSPGPSLLKISASFKMIDFYIRIKAVTFRRREKQKDELHTFADTISEAGVS